MPEMTGRVEITASVRDSARSAAYHGADRVLGSTEQLREVGALVQCVL